MTRPKLENISVVFLPHQNRFIKNQGVQNITINTIAKLEDLTTVQKKKKKKKSTGNTGGKKKERRPASSLHSYE